MNKNKNHVQAQAYASGFAKLMGEEKEKKAYYGSQYGQMPMYPTYGHGFYDGSSYAPQQQQQKKKEKSWYQDPWVWGGLGAAGLLGGAYAHNTGMLDPVYNWFGGSSSGETTADSSDTTDAGAATNSQDVSNTGQSATPAPEATGNQVPNNANTTTSGGGPIANNSQDAIPKNQESYNTLPQNPWDSAQSSPDSVPNSYVEPGTGNMFSGQSMHSEQLQSQQDADYQRELEEEYQRQIALKQDDNSAFLQQAGSLGGLSQVARDLTNATNPVNKNSLISEYMRQREQVSENIRMLEEIGDPRAEGLKKQLAQISQQVGGSLFGGSDIGDAAIGSMRFDEHSNMRDALSSQQDQLDYLGDALTYSRFGNNAQEVYYFDQMVDQVDKYAKAIQDYKAQGLNTAGFERELERMMSTVAMLRNRMSGGNPIGPGGN